MSEEVPAYGKQVRLECLLPAVDPNYQKPSPDEVRLVATHLNFTGSQIALLFGVQPKSFRRWVGGQVDIPYSAWRLLLYEAGLIKHDSIDNAAEYIKRINPRKRQPKM